MASVNEKKVRELRERMARLDEANLDLSAENEDLKQQLDFATAAFEDSSVYELGYWAENGGDGSCIVNHAASKSAAIEEELKITDENPEYGWAEPSAEGLRLVTKDGVIYLETSEHVGGKGIVYKNVELKRI